MPARLTALSAVAISLITLWITIRRDTHKLALRLSHHEYGAIVLEIVNRSSFAISIGAVGYFDDYGNVNWIDQVGEFRSNQSVSYPYKIDGRFSHQTQLVLGRHIPFSDEAHGYLVQLVCGRTFVLSDSAPVGASLRMHCRSLLSRLSGGSAGFARPAPKRL